MLCFHSVRIIPVHSLEVNHLFLEMMFVRASNTPQRHVLRDFRMTMV